MEAARGLFVTGTDTGAGKTIVAGAICAALARRGVAVAPYKPVLTGLDDPPDPTWPRDHELLAAASGAADANRVAPLRFGPAASPHLAAELAGEAIDPAALRAAAPEEATVVVEGVGGLMVPFTPGYSVRDLARDLGFPLVVAARPGLGTINHTLLTLEAARAVSLDVRAVVLTPWPGQPSVLERSNRDTIVRLGRIAVHTLPPLARADPELLASAGAQLPVEDWLDRPSAG